ncbi:DUF551 domain-containing protein [Bariatricus sp. SGI.161]|uniref:DUF551 domain-containing protein n=1 Tax=Bariatricus sp. SGI.161 TaxID=3420550 RepID=UPI003CFC31E1
MIDEKKLIESLIASLNTGKECFPIDLIIECIEEQPKVGEWIPCSERLPNESGTYIVNAIENSIVHVTFAKWMTRMKKWNLSGSRSYWKVSAWQPLPEPYQPKGE